VEFATGVIGIVVPEEKIVALVGKGALRSGLLKAGFDGAKKAAHHIVAKAAKAAKPARDILAKFGININDKANGVFLSTAFHQSMHTNAYYEAVNAALQAAASGGKQAVLDALGAIAAGLRGK